MKKFFGFWIIWVIVGIAMLAYPLITSSFSFLSHPVADSAEDIAALYDTDGEYRPFAEFRFETVIFSGLYLCAGEDDTPTDWVMCGYIDGRFLPFYVKATSVDPPDDQTNVSYILRRPSDVNTVHDEWVVTSLVDDIVNESDYSYDDATSFFTSEVLQADRNGALILTACAGCGIVFIAAGILFLAARIRRSKSSPEAAVSTPMGGAEAVEFGDSDTSTSSADVTPTDTESENEGDDDFGLPPL